MSAPTKTTDPGVTGRSSSPTLIRARRSALATLTGAVTIALVLALALRSALLATLPGALLTALALILALVSLSLTLRILVLVVLVRHVHDSLASRDAGGVCLCETSPLQSPGQHRRQRLRGRRNQDVRSAPIAFAALWPGAPVTPPPGWAPEPQR